MRKLLYLLLLCSFLGLTGCDSKEEAMATVEPGPMAGYMAVIGDEITIGENQVVKAGEMLAEDRI